MTFLVDTSTRFWSWDFSSLICCIFPLFLLTLWRRHDRKDWIICSVVFILCLFGKHHRLSQTADDGEYPSFIFCEVEAVSFNFMAGTMYGRYGLRQQQSRPPVYVGDFMMQRLVLCCGKIYTCKRRRCRVRSATQKANSVLDNG